MNKIAALTLALLAGTAGASTIQIQTGTFYGPGFFTEGADFQSTVEGAITTSSWAMSYDNLGIVIDDGALKSTTTFVAATAGDDWTFRAGVDFGKGGAIYLDGVLQQSYDHDMWWNYSYSDNAPGEEQFFQFTISGLSAGAHKLTLYGLESCCSGNQQQQYQIGSGAFMSFGADDGLPAIPEAPNVAMVLAGLGLVGTQARRRSNKTS